jgi:hypothetical protein
VNCTNLGKVNQSDKTVIGTLQILSHPGKVLFDTGATTSFISQEFVDLYGIPCNKLEYPITVLSAGGTILVTHLRQEQVIMIRNCVYLANLFLIPVKDMAVILGMDWLEENGAQIDCREKTMSLRSPGGGRIVTRVNSTNVLDEGLRIGEIGRRMNSKVKSVKQGCIESKRGCRT